MTDKIEWTNEKRRLSQLIPWERNPRQIKESEVARLQASLEEFGQVEAVAIGPDNELYNGHQRLKSWAHKYGDIEIDVRVASRVLTEVEREKLTVLLHAGATGQWNWDELSGWQAGDLVAWGFTEDMLRNWNTDAVALREMLASNFQFNPNEQPEIGAVNVDDGDIDDEAARLAGQFKNEKEYVSVTCPHCGVDFYLDRKDIKDAVNR